MVQIHCGDCCYHAIGTDGREHPIDICSATAYEKRDTFTGKLTLIDPVSCRCRNSRGSCFHFASTPRLVPDLGNECMSVRIK